MIILEKNGKLILDDCLLHNACGDEWLGITCKSRKDITLIGDTRILDVAGLKELTVDQH